MGLDPDRSIIFVQSDVAEHTELAWLFNSVTPIGELERMTQFKDKARRFESVPAGILNYPVLQAADILLYRADAVPVGEDQRQHLELTCEITRKWNATYGAYFPEPEALVGKEGKILGLDGEAKMSKSLGNTVPITASPDDVWARGPHRGHRSAARATRRPRPLRGMQRAYAARLFLRARSGRRRRLPLPERSAWLRGMQAHPGRLHQRHVRSHAGAGERTPRPPGAHPRRPSSRTARPGPALSPAKR